MRDYERNAVPLSSETITLKSGVGIYPIKEEFLGFANARMKEQATDDESVEAQMLVLATLTQQAREVVERQGGVFNGIVERVVHRQDQEWMGEHVAIRVTYALAYKPE